MMTPDERAARCAQIMERSGGLIVTLGIELLAVRAAYARMSMAVNARTINGLGVCHGGSIFALADTALAFAANSHNALALTRSCTIAFKRPGRYGSTLFAEAREVERTDRTGIYRVEITDDDGTSIATCDGETRTIDGCLFEE